jgi:hypothetical protein
MEYDLFMYFFNPYRAGPVGWTFLSSQYVQIDEVMLSWRYSQAPKLRFT